MAVASLVLGIVSVVMALIFPYMGWLAAIIGVVGLVLGILGRKKQPEKKGMATAGMVLSIIGLAFGIVLYIACVACVSAASSAAEEALLNAGFEQIQ